MRQIGLLFALVPLLGCGEAESDTKALPPIQTYTQPVTDKNVDEYENEDAPSYSPRRKHNYDAKDGLFYSYFSALSEDDRKAGRAASTAITFAYLGKRGDKHVLARVLSDGRVLEESYCNNPCKVIAYADGSQIAFTESSVIGAAFADAIAGRLETASYNPPNQYVTAAPQTPPVRTQQNGSPQWSADEAGLIFRWMDANEKCRGGSDPAQVSDACANRDEVFGPALAEAGICYGRENEPASRSAMHRCESGSQALDW